VIREIKMNDNSILEVLTLRGSQVINLLSSKAHT